MAPVKSAISLDLQGEKIHQTLGGFKCNADYEPIKAALP